MTQMLLLPREAALPVMELPPPLPAPRPARAWGRRLVPLLLALPLPTALFVLGVQLFGPGGGAA